MKVVVVVVVVVGAGTRQSREHRLVAGADAVNWTIIITISCSSSSSSSILFVRDTVQPAHVDTALVDIICPVPFRQNVKYETWISGYSA